MKTNWKAYLLHGLIAGLLAGLAALIYQRIYAKAMGTDFAKIVQPAGMFISSTVGCLLMGVAYALLHRLRIERFKGWLNVLIAVLSFASVMGPFATTLPLDVEMPELFPGLTVPMHFFPALAFFTIAPFFRKQTEIAG